MTPPDRYDRDPPSAPAGKWLSVVLLTACVVLALSLWFSVSAVVPTLRAARDLSDSQAAWLASSVSLGFVAGTLASALLNLADRLEPRRFFMAAALTAAAANAAILAFTPESQTAIVLRFVTGACMAGIYPVGMRIASTWATRDTGFLLGLLTGAICAGSGLPHLIDALGGLNWMLTIALASVLAAAAGLLINLVRLGPINVRPARFHPLFAIKAITVPTVRLANLGYWGHKWENYAMWAWIGSFLNQSFSLNGSADSVEVGFQARLATFAVFAVGAFGCLIAGLLADRFGRTLIAGGALAISGTCALITGFLLGAEPWLVVAVSLVWGFALIADSGQFSASVIELSDRAYIGTMLTVQTCVGYLITLVSIHVVQVLEGRFGWGWAFAALAVGPVIGIAAMIRLRRHPDAVRLASGRF
ncbi:MAG: MFS transporter [Rhodospirillales bacterium]|nr:MFS transporter [Rhodospirillales bacterium]